MFKDIYIFDAQSMAKRINEDAITEIQALKNFIIFMIFFAAGYDIPFDFELTTKEETGLSLVPLAIWIISALINYYGLWLIYQTNSKGDNKEFFKRFSAFSLPVSMRVTIYFFFATALVMAIFYLTIEAFNILAFGFFTTLLAILVFGYIISFYILMRKYIAIAAGNT